MLSIGKSGWQSSRGFSLVELMVSLVLGLLVIAGASRVYLGLKSSYVSMEQISSRQEALRFFADVLSLDIRSSAITGVSVSASGSELTLTYDNRVRDPYCDTGAGDLTEVKYSFLANAVSLSFSCDDGSGSDEELVRNVEDLVFQDFVNIEDIEGRVGYVVVNIDFPDLPDESASESSFSFRVANREAVAR